MRAEGGLTLVEVLISAALFVLVLGMFGGMLYSSQRSQITSAEYSRANDQVQIALQSMDRQIRSGYVVDVLATPPSGADAVVKIYSEADGSPKCIAWAVADANPSGATGVAQLFTASWTPTSPASPVPAFGSGAWRLVASDLWNWLNPAGAVVPFTVLPSIAAGVLPTLQVRFTLNASSRAQAMIEVTSVFTSRNIPREGTTIPGVGTLRGAAC